MKNEDSFIKFKDTIESVVIDNEKLYIVECDILMDEKQLYSYFLKMQPGRQVQEEENDKKRKKHD